MSVVNNQLSTEFQDISLEEAAKIQGGNSTIINGRRFSTHIEKGNQGTSVSIFGGTSTVIPRPGLSLFSRKPSPVFEGVDVDNDGTIDQHKFFTKRRRTQKRIKKILGRLGFSLG